MIFYDLHYRITIGKHEILKIIKAKMAKQRLMSRLGLKPGKDVISMIRAA